MEKEQPKKRKYGNICTEVQMWEFEKTIAKHDLAYCSSELFPEYLIISTLDLTASL